MNAVPKAPINSFEAAILFYKTTRPKVSDLLKEANTISEKLGTSPSMIGKDGTPLPLELDDKETTKLDQLEKWIGTHLTHYSKSLEELLPEVDKSLDLVPNLLRGIAEEANTGTTQLSKRISLATKNIIAGKDKSHELDTIEADLHKKIAKLNFFKEEVGERFDTFKDSLIEYISCYCILNHLVRCVDHIADGSPKNIKKFIKNLSSFENPF